MLPWLTPPQKRRARTNIVYSWSFWLCSKGSRSSPLTTDLKAQFALFGLLTQTEEDLSQTVFVETLANLPPTHDFFKWMDSFEGV